MEQRLIEMATHTPGTGEHSENVKHELKVLLFDHLQELIYECVKRDCYGCQVDHPSQVQHVLCLMTDCDVWVDLYIHEVLAKFNFSKVMDKWYPVCQSEPALASRLWKQLKEEISQNQSAPHEGWVGNISDRLKRIYEHGHI